MSKIKFISRIVVIVFSSFVSGIIITMLNKLILKLLASNPNNVDLHHLLNSFSLPILPLYSMIFFGFLYSGFYLNKEKNLKIAKNMFKLYIAFGIITYLGSFYFTSEIISN